MIDITEREPQGACPSTVGNERSDHNFVVVTKSTRTDVSTPYWKCTKCGVVLTKGVTESVTP